MGHMHIDLNFIYLTYYLVIDQGATIKKYI